jgi:hypothetical protein
MTLNLGAEEGPRPAAGRTTTGSFNLAAAFVAAFGLMAVGALLVTATESWGLFALFALPVVALSVVVVGVEVYHCRVNVFRLSVAATVVWYFWPMIAASIPGSAIQNPSDFSGTANAIYVIIMALVPPLILSFMFPKPVLQADWTSLVQHRRFLSGVLVACALVQLLLILTGKWTYGSLASHIIKADKTYLLFMNSLELVTGPFCGAMAAVLLRTRRARSLEFWLICAALLVQLGWSLIGGRRLFATTLIIAGAAFFNIFWRGVPTPRRAVQAVAAAIVGLVVIAFAWQAFYMLRFVSYSLEAGAAIPSVSEMYQRAKTMDSRLLAFEYKNNLATRGLIIESVVTVVETANGHLFGQGLVNSTMGAMPAALFPGKREWEAKGGGVQEILWTNQLGVPINDYANTLVLDSYADFSIFGLTIYLTLLDLVFVMLARVFGRSILCQCALSAVFVQYLINVETGFGTAITTARDMTLILAIAAAIYMAGSGKLSSAGRGARPSLDSGA